MWLLKIFVIYFYSTVSNPLFYHIKKLGVGFQTCAICYWLCSLKSNKNTFDIAPGIHHVNALFKYVNAFGKGVCRNTLHLEANWRHTEYAEGSIHTELTISSSFVAACQVNRQNKWGPHMWTLLL